LKKATKVELTESDKLGLYSLQFHGSEPLGSLAKSLGIKESTLQGKIGRWYQDGIITQRVFIDTYRLGATGFEIFFSPAKDKQGLSAKLIDAVKESPGVRWFYRTAGKYDYHIGIEARNTLEVTRHLEQLDALAPGMFNKRDSCVSLGYWWFGRKYLAPEGIKHTRRFEAMPVQAPVKIDEVDHSILKVLGSRGSESLRGISSVTGLPQSTIGYRVQSLTKSGIITGLPYLVSPGRLGMHIFRVQVSLNTLSAETHKNILRWCQQNRRVVSMMRLVGVWDYILRCEVERPEQVGEFTDALQETFGPLLRDWAVISVIKEYSFCFYPLEHPPHVGLS
jgi:DNA-binding Lrp family transcriptional regulator